MATAMDDGRSDSLRKHRTKIVLGRRSRILDAFGVYRSTVPPYTMTKSWIRHCRDGSYNKLSL